MNPDSPGIVAAVKEGGNIPVHPDLHAELNYQKDSAGARSGMRPDHGACYPDALADGPHHDRWRLSWHVIDH